jgi:hypothetical protein
VTVARTFSSLGIIRVTSGVTNWVTKTVAVVDSEARDFLEQTRNSHATVILVSVLISLAYQERTVQSVFDGLQFKFSSKFWIVNFV